MLAGPCDATQARAAIVLRTTNRPLWLARPEWRPTATLPWTSLGAGRDAISGYAIRQARVRKAHADDGRPCFPKEDIVRESWVDVPVRPSL